MHIFEATDAEKPLDYYVEKVRILPKIAKDDPRIAELPNQPINQFGNNFYLLWLSILNPTEEGGVIEEIYAERAKKLPSWDTFVTKEAEAIAEIKQVLDEVYQPYREIADRLMDRLNSGDWETYDALNAAADHPLGVRALTVYVWDQLNPLLEAVAKAMEQAGIDPEQFYS